MSEGVLQIFTRAPVPGNTKTRLIPILGSEGAAEFHKNILLKTLQTAQSSCFANIQVWCSSPHPFLQKCSRDFSYPLQRQKGKDLGERMLYALQQGIYQHKFAVLIGSDCPSLTASILDRAYLALKQGQDLVLGASEDGGYYLIGMCHAHRILFSDIYWGGKDVAEVTRKKAQNLALKPTELDMLYDIDTSEDYRRFTHLP